MSGRSESYSVSRIAGLLFLQVPLWILRRIAEVIVLAWALGGLALAIVMVPIRLVWKIWCMVCLFFFACKALREG